MSKLVMFFKRVLIGDKEHEMDSDNVEQVRLNFSFTEDECLVLLDSLFDSKDYLTQIYSRNPQFGEENDFATKICRSCLLNRDELIERIRSRVNELRSIKFVRHKGI